MQNRTPTPQQPQAPQIDLADIYYVLFKHKWKIILCSLAGFAAAAGLYFVMPPPYVSEAKLLVRYVQDSKSLAPAGSDAQVKPADARGEGIMSSEAEILSSLDVAAAVVDVIGAEKIFGKGTIATNREVAAVALRRGLLVDVPKKGNVLGVTYQNSNPEVVQQVLRQVIDTYFKKHIEIHRNLGVLDEFLTQKTDQLRSRLTETEDELRKLKTKAGVVSLDESRKTYSDFYSKLRQELFNAQVELEERQAALNELLKAHPAEAQTTNTNAVTNAVAQTKMKLPPDLVAEYTRLKTRLDSFWKREQDLLSQFTPENSLVKEIRGSIADVERQKKAMEAATPALLDEDMAPANTRSAAVERREGKPAMDFAVEQARVIGLAAKIKTLNAQFDKIRSVASGVDDAETSLVQLQRKKELEESQYRYYSTSLEQARVDSTLSAGKLSNISEIQSPSTPLRDSKALKKKMGMAAAGGVGLGLGLAFLLEMFLAQTIRRSGELESKYQIPLFLTIPELSTSSRRKALGAGRPEAPALGNGENKSLPAVVMKTDERTEIAPWDEKHELYPFSEALRDRLVTFFELKGMTHKPKLIALTSCSHGAGVTTLAAGLAATLSETGEGNVLLVDLTLGNGAAHPFYKGKPSCGLSDVLEFDKRPAAMVHEKLYMAHGGVADDRMPKILPKRISHLLPKLQASDYDYIIFDMPPIDQTSVTPRLAGFMDMVFLVAEDGETNSAWLKQATKMLHESKANLGAIFNKRRTYVPKWLHQEF